MVFLECFKKKVEKIVDKVIDWKKSCNFITNPLSIGYKLKK